MAKAKLNEQEVTTRFIQGMDMFKNGMPQPREQEQRIESLLLEARQKSVS